MKTPILAALLALASIASCARTGLTVKEVVMADGSTWWKLTCKDAIGDCVTLAHQQCPGGYEMSGTEERSNPDVNASGMAVPISHTRKNVALPGELFVRCKAG